VGEAVAVVATGLVAIVQDSLAAVEMSCKTPPGILEDAPHEELESQLEMKVLEVEVRLAWLHFLIPTLALPCQLALLKHPVLNPCLKGRVQPHLQVFFLAARLC